MSPGLGRFLPGFRDVVLSFFLTTPVFWCSKSFCFNVILIPSLTERIWIQLFLSGHVQLSVGNNLTVYSDLVSIIVNAPSLGENEMWSCSTSCFALKTLVLDECSLSCVLIYFSSELLTNSVFFLNSLYL